MAHRFTLLSPSAGKCKSIDILILINKRLNEINGININWNKS